MFKRNTLIHAVKLLILCLCRNSLNRAKAAWLLRLLDHTQKHTPGRTPPNKWSARRRGRYLHNTQQTHETKIHALSGIRTRDINNREAGDPRLREHGHRDLLADIHTNMTLTWVKINKEVFIENKIELIAYFKFIHPLEFTWENQSWLCQRFLTVQLEKCEI
jgi:hypothetical protein